MDHSIRTLNKLSSFLQKQMTQASKSLSQWLSAGSAVTLLVTKTKEALSELKELDTILAELNRNNRGLSRTALQDLEDHAFETAAKYGRSAADYLSGVLSASRSGHDNPQAMAELSLALQSAGSIPADLADRLILTTDKAWQMNGSVSELTRTLDGMYRITSQNSVNLDELSRGLSAISSRAASLGMDVDETAAALAAMLAATRENGIETADALKAILHFTHQISDETAGIDAAGLAAYESACSALNVKLKETKDGVASLRAPMEILGELSAAYRHLSDSDPRRAGLLNSVGGDFRAAQLDALLGQWDTYEAMLQQYARGTGSLTAAAEQTSDSWEGSLNRLSNTWTATVRNIADSGAVTTTVNGLNNLLSLVEKITDKLGSLKTVSLGAGLFATLKNVGRPERSGPVNVLNMPTMVSVLQDTEVFLSSNVRYTG